MLRGREEKPQEGTGLGMRRERGELGRGIINRRSWGVFQLVGDFPATPPLLESQEYTGERAQQPVQGWVFPVDFGREQPLPLPFHPRLVRRRELGFLQPAREKG